MPLFHVVVERKCSDIVFSESVLRICSYVPVWILECKDSHLGMDLIYGIIFKSFSFKARFSQQPMASNAFHGKIERWKVLKCRMSRIQGPFNNEIKSTQNHAQQACLNMHSLSACLAQNLDGFLNVPKH